MAKINVLEKQIAELIAAGEVVERPASIVKELVENAVDAGATAVTVEIQKGGISYIRVTDNGSGIERDDVKNAFLRHATSKVRTEEDLNSILTMGFRGEALASIAAMCRVEVLTHTKDNVAGVSYVIEGGEELRFEEAGCPIGTTITVRDVFYNTPARMKFLKKDVSEGNSISATIEKTALGNPGVAFSFIRDGEQKWRTPGDGQLISAVRTLLGREFAQNVIKVNYTSEGMILEGFICKPQIARGSRSLQNFFINSRFVRSKTCMAALEESYRNAVMVGRFPSCVLNLRIPPQTVDVNVHPAKIEVRFASERSVFDLIYYGCKTALGTAKITPELTVREQSSDKKSASYVAVLSVNQDVKQQSLSVSEYKTLVAAQKNSCDQVDRYSQLGSVLSKENHVIHESCEQTLKSPPVNYSSGKVQSSINIETNEDTKENDEMYKMTSGLYENVHFVSEIFDTYTILENDGELLFVDKHAAHERILFNRLIKEGIGEERQILLSPISVQLSQEEHSVVLENLELLNTAGVTAEDFGNNFIVVRDVAPILSGTNISEIVTEFAQKLLRSNNNTLPQELENLYHTIACRAAVKSGDKTASVSLEHLIELLREDGDVSHCPHGRPVAVCITRHELEKKFGRLG